MCKEYKIHNADIIIKEDCDVDDLVRMLPLSRNLYLRHKSIDLTSLDVVCTDLWLAAGGCD